ncbi:MAG: AAA 11 domain-containing protein, partial [Bacteroidetes bacterium]|nr:AAA 11 domain-containing protein [Bacteroidota bacterium]
AEVCKQLGIDSTMIARVGLPLNQHADALGPISFELAVDAAKAEKRKTFQERASLLDLYWRIKVKHALHESYTRTISDAREKLTSVKKQLDQVTREIAASKEGIQQIEKASMMDRLKKGFNKDDLVAAQKQLAEKQPVQKRLMTAQQSLSNEILRLESSGPISFEDGMNFREAAKRIEELGGIQKVTETVNDFIKVDEAAMLNSKSFIGTTAAGALSHPILKSMKFDFVIVDDAEAIMLPLLAAVATFAKDSIVVSGDPFQLALEPLSNTDLALQLLHRDIFLYTAQSEDLHRLFEWAEKNPLWSVLLSSQFATTPKLASFVAAVLFDEKVKVQPAPQTKGKVYFIDTSDLRSQCRQYVGKKKILPSNEQQTKKTLECVKHALMEPGRHASDVGVIVPFSGPTFFTRLQLRVNSMSNLEVGLPGTFRGRRKKAVIFDTSVAGMDFSMRPMDDRKVGDNRIARLWNTVFSCAAEDIYVLADMSLFKTLYKDRLFARILMLLQAQSDGLPPLAAAVKKFDELEWDKRASLFSVARKGASAVAASAQAKPQRVDHDMEMRMKMMAKQQSGTKPQAAERNFEREIYTAVNRVRGFWTDVNLLSQYLGGDLLFRRSITAEQSGGVKTDLVFFSKGSSEARIRHDIRSLKAFYSPDMEATIEAGKNKIAMEVSKVFQEMLGKSQPGNPVEWSTAYVNFLSKLELYLSWISAQLRK